MQTDRRTPTQTTEDTDRPRWAWEEHPFGLGVIVLAIVLAIVLLVRATAAPQPQAFQSTDQTPDGVVTPVVQKVRDPDTGCTMLYFWQDRRLVSVVPKTRKDGRPDCE